MITAKQMVAFPTPNMSHFVETFSKEFLQSAASSQYDQKKSPNVY